MGEAVWAGGQLVALLGGAYMFYGFVAGMWNAAHEPAALVLTKDQFALVA